MKKKKFFVWKRFLLILDHFCPFTPIFCPKNQNFPKLKKRSGDHFFILEIYVYEKSGPLPCTVMMIYSTGRDRTDEQTESNIAKMSHLYF